jgi:hypothetical protein
VGNDQPELEPNATPSDVEPPAAAQPETKVELQPPAPDAAAPEPEDPAPAPAEPVNIPAAPSLSSPPERLTPGTSLAGSARDQVRPDGSLLQPKPRGPLAGLREKLGG